MVWLSMGAREISLHRFGSAGAEGKEDFLTISGLVLIARGAREISLQSELWF